MQVVADEAAKILHRCDKNGDGKIGEEEFEAYYLQTAEVRQHEGGERERCTHRETEKRIHIHTHIQRDRARGRSGWWRRALRAAGRGKQDDGECWVAGDRQVSQEQGEASTEGRGGAGGEGAAGGDRGRGMGRRARRVGEGKARGH